VLIYESQKNKVINFNYQQKKCSALLKYKLSFQTFIYLCETRWQWVEYLKEILHSSALQTFGRQNIWEHLEIEMFH